MLRLDADEETTGSHTGQRKTLLLSFAGAVLDVSWRFADIGIASGAQVPIIPVLYITRYPSGQRAGLTRRMAWVKSWHESN